MWTIITSLLVGFLGLLVARVALRGLATAGCGRDPHVYWSLGLLALLPAWLVAFVTLLPSTTSVMDPISRKYTGKPFPFRDPEGRVALVIEVEKARHAKLPFEHTPPKVAQAGR
jgi:hypothetical protein